MERAFRVRCFFFLFGSDFLWVSYFLVYRGFLYFFFSFASKDREGSMFFGLDE